MNYECKSKLNDEEIQADDAAQIVAEGCKALDRLNNLYRKYVKFPDDNSSLVATLWSAATYAFPVAWYSPRLLISSKGPECGKSTLLKLLQATTPGGYKVDSATEAGIRRKVASMKGKPFTLIIDEADSFFPNKPDLRAIINAGWERGGRHLSATKGDNDQWADDEQSLWVSLAIAGIGEGWIWEALPSRSFIIKLQKKRFGESVADFDTDAARQEAIACGRAVGRWVMENLDVLKEANPVMPPALNNRAEKNWRLILAIADLAGDHWPETARRVAVAMCGNTDAVRVLTVVHDIFEQRGTDWIWSNDLSPEIGKCGVSPTGWQTILREEFGIESKDIKRNSQNKKGYRREQFEAVWEMFEIGRGSGGSGEVAAEM